MSKLWIIGGILLLVRKAAGTTPPARRYGPIALLPSDSIYSSGGGRPDWQQGVDGNWRPSQPGWTVSYDSAGRAVWRDPATGTEHYAPGAMGAAKPGTAPNGGVVSGEAEVPTWLKDLASKYGWPATKAAGQCFVTQGNSKEQFAACMAEKGQGEAADRIYGERK